MRLHLVCAVLTVAVPASSVGAEEPAAKQKPVRVLLVTTDASREFVFGEALLIRAEQAKQVELAVYASATESKVAADAQLKHFPNLLRPADRVKAEEKLYNLSRYEVVIAVDFDWTKVEPESLVLLQKWVERGGGLIVTAGPMHTPALARAKPNDALQPVRELLPVVFHKPDNQPAAAPVNRTPVVLTFGENKPAVPFLKLDPDGKNDLAGWDDFFGGVPPRRGFFMCFPVESVKKGAVAPAKFELVREKAQPWLATHTVGKGRVMWFGSSEIWRLRAYSEAFHERFWLEMTRYAAAPGRGQ